MIEDPVALPPIKSEIWHALLAAAKDFAAHEPWLDMYDNDLVGLTDPATGTYRLGTVLGNAGEVFGAAFYPHPNGVRWLLRILENAAPTLDAADGLEAVKIEFVSRRELSRPELAHLQEAKFKAPARGCNWPQFQSAKPGWHPWFIDQTEAEQLLVDLPRLTAFCRLLRKHPGLMDDKPQLEIPFLPQPMPERELRVEDLEWRPMLLPPEIILPFAASDEQMTRLRALERVPSAAYEFSCTFVPGGGVVAAGRPCHSRISLLVENRRGVVLGMDTDLAIKPFSACAGNGLVKALTANGFLPGKILFSNPRLPLALGQLCEELGIKLKLVNFLSASEDTLDSLANFLMTGQM